MAAGLVGAVIGSVTSAATGAISGAKQRKFAKKEARKARQWQREMSSTAYQRATADLRKAGLNPLLAYTQGGASTPSGAKADTPSKYGLEGVANAAVQGYTAHAQLKSMQEQAKTMYSQRRLNEANELKMYSARGLDIMNTKIAREQRDRLKYENIRAKHQGEMSDTTVGRGLDWIERTRNAFGFSSGAGVHRGSSTVTKGRPRK